jgi:replicative DNA helicase
MTTKKGFDKLIDNNLPPYNTEAEVAIIGALFLKPDAIYDIIPIMKADDFYQFPHTLIFRAMHALMESDGNFDLITVHKYLEMKDESEITGGPGYLSSCIDIAVTPDNITYHAKIVHDCAVLRRVCTASIETVSEIYAQKLPAVESIENAEKRLMQAVDDEVKKGFMSMAEIQQKAYEHIEKMQARKGQVFGLSTGFYDVDTLLGGLENGKLYIVAARPGMGKSIFATNAGIAIAKGGVPTANFNLEMSDIEIGLRSQCAHAEVDFSKIKTGELTDNDWEKIANSAEVLSSYPYYLDDTAHQTIHTLKSLTRQAVGKYGIKAVFIDYLQLLTASGRFENKNVEVAEYSRQLKVLAKDLNIPVVALCQLNRKCEERSDKRPQLSDLRDSGAIEQDADVVLFIYRPEVYFNDPKLKGVCEVIVAKNRGGALGTVFLAFDGPRTCFKNISQKHEDENPF